MVENLEHLIRRAACDPRSPRTALFKELLRSETYLLTVDAPLEEGEVKRVEKSEASFPVWADKDPELGGVWVPVFPARDRVRDFVAARRLKTPRGKEVSKTFLTRKGRAYKRREQRDDSFGGRNGARSLTNW